MNALTVILISIILVIISANVFVTIRVRQSDFFEPSQKFFQYGLIWLFPIIGAVLCNVFSRDTISPHSGTYPQAHDIAPYDAGRGMENSNVDYLGGGQHGE